MHITSSWRKPLVGICAAALAVPLALGAGVASAAPTPAAQAAPAKAAPINGPCAGSVLPGFAVNGQTVTVSVQSTAMQRTVPVQVLLPPNFNISDAGTKYPELYQLDGLRADPNITDWTRKADTQRFFSDKNVLVVQPIGGNGSFYQNWAQPDAGILNTSKQTPTSPVGQLRWETFLTNELPCVIGEVFHGNGNRAVSGLSMGGFSAFSLAAKHPGLYAAAASYSGFPSTQILGLQEFLRYVLVNESGATNADDLWGPPGSALVTENNPAAQVTKLTGTSLYLSAGTGGNGPYDEPLGFAGLSGNYVGAILEVVANYSSQAFAQQATASGVPIQTVDLSNPGVHAWPYWSAEYKKSWPQLAQAIGATTGFTVQGAIAVKWNQLGGANGVLGNPTTSELDFNGGKVSHFQGGDIYWSAATGAHEVQGTILAKYNDPRIAALLGFPLNDEATTPNPLRFGKYNQFTNGYIYWTPGLTPNEAHEVHGGILAEWGRQGYENSRYGFPVSDEHDITNGKQSDFQGGSIQFINGQIINVYK